VLCKAQKLKCLGTKNKLNCILGTERGSDCLLILLLEDICQMNMRLRKVREVPARKNLLFSYELSTKNNNCCRPQFMEPWWESRALFLLIKRLSMIYIDCICMAVTRKLKTKPSAKQQTRQELSTSASTFRHAQKQTFERSSNSLFLEVSSVRRGNWKSEILNLLALV